MLSRIFDTFCGELQKLFENTGETILRDTQFKPEDMPAHTIPVIVISLKDTPDVKQLIGGATKADFGWHIKAYFYDANAGLDPDEGFSVEAYQVIEKIFNHVAKQEWLTEEFNQVCADFSYSLTLAGIGKAESLSIDSGIIPGYQIFLDTVAINKNFGEESTMSGSMVPLENIVQLYDESSMPPL